MDLDILKRLKDNKIKVVIYRVNKNSLLPFFLRGWLVIPKVWFDLRQAKHQVLSLHSTIPFMIASRFSGSKILKTYYGTELSSYHFRKNANLPIKIKLSKLIISKITDAILLALEKTSFALADEVVTISEYLAYEANKLFGKKVDVIYLGAESNLFKDQQRRNESKNFILSVSRIVPYKGFDILIEAFKRANEKIGELYLVIVGSAANQDYLRYIKEISNEKVEIKYNIDERNLGYLYSSCLFYVTCDLWFPWSLTLLEASFFGKPLLAIKTGAAVEIIKDEENGLLADNVEDLTTKIIRLSGDAKLRSRFGKKAKEMVERFNWDKSALKYENKLTKLVKI